MEKKTNKAFFVRKKYTMENRHAMGGPNQLMKWAEKITSNKGRDYAYFTDDCDAHPLWILIKNCAFKQREGVAFSEEAIYSILEGLCQEEYMSKFIGAERARYVHVDSLRPIRDVVPVVYLQLLMASENIPGARHYYLSLYPYIREELDAIGTPEKGFQILLIEAGNRCHEKVKGIVSLIKDEAPMFERAVKKHYSKLLKETECFVVKTTSSNFDKVRCGAIELVVAAEKNKPSQSVKDWIVKIKKEFQFG